jgi:hypothetical protein
MHGRSGMMPPVPFCTSPDDRGPVPVRKFWVWGPQRIRTPGLVRGENAEKKRLTRSGGYGLIGRMYAHRKPRAIAAHREHGSRNLRALNLTLGLLLAGSLLALLIKTGAGAG